MAVTRDELITSLVTYRANVYALMQKSVDPNKVNVLGIRYETSARIINELLKSNEDAADKIKMEAVALLEK